MPSPASPSVAAVVTSTPLRIPTPLSWCCTVPRTAHATVATGFRPARRQVLLSCGGGHHRGTDELDGVTRDALRAMLDLLATRHAGGGDQRARWLLADRREEPHAADLHRQVVVVGLEAERPGHATAAGIHLDNGRSRDAR